MDQPNETLSLEEGLQAIEKLIAEQQVRIDEWLKTTRRLAGSIIKSEQYPAWLILKPEAHSIPSEFLLMDFPQHLVRQLGAISDAYGEGGIADNRPVVLFWHQSDKAREISVRRWTEMCQTRDETPEVPASGLG